MRDGKEEVAEMYAEVFNQIWDYAKKKFQDDEKMTTEEMLKSFKEEYSELVKELKEKDLLNNDQETKDIMLDNAIRNVNEYSRKFDNHNQVALQEISHMKQGIDYSSDNGERIFNQLSKLEQVHLQNSYDKNNLLDHLIEKANHLNISNENSENEPSPVEKNDWKAEEQEGNIIDSYKAGNVYEDKDPFEMEENKKIHNQAREIFAIKNNELNDEMNTAIMLRELEKKGVDIKHLKTKEEVLDTYKEMNGVQDKDIKDDKLENQNNLDENEKEEIEVTEIEYEYEMD